MADYIDGVNRFVWGVPALLLILSVGLSLSIRTRWIQFRFLSKALKRFMASFHSRKEQGGVSPYKALCTALAATVGTGNIAGVAGAIAIGGPGAIFWMWICAILGMVTKFAEATLAVRYRIRDENGGFIGGPMYIIQQGLGKKWQFLAGIYSFFGVVAVFGVGSATQVNAAIGGINSAITALGGFPSQKLSLAIGIAFALFAVLVLCGGAKRIGSAASFLVPVASVFYLLMGFGVLLVRYSAIGDAFRAIFLGAFSPGAVTGGLLGSAFQALRIGASRGVFTNEAGMGTASIAHATAEVSHPVEQGLMGIVEVFLDTIVICTVTALVILSSGIPIAYGRDLGICLTADAFASVYGSWINIPLAVALCSFAAATVLGWGLYGARCAQFLFGTFSWKWFAIAQAASLLLGAVLSTETVWALSETANGLMAIPNLIALMGLCPEVVRLINEYKQVDLGGTYENIYQCKSVRTVPHAEVPPSVRQGKSRRKEDLSPEYRPA